MDIQPQNNQDLQKVADLVDEIRFAMLTTEEEDGSLRSRPMATQQAEFDGDLWFLFVGALLDRAIRLFFERRKLDTLAIEGGARVGKGCLRACQRVGVWFAFQGGQPRACRVDFGARGIKISWRHAAGRLA